MLKKLYFLFLPKKPIQSNIVDTKVPPHFGDKMCSENLVIEVLQKNSYMWAEMTKTTFFVKKNAGDLNLNVHLSHLNISHVCEVPNSLRMRFCFFCQRSVFSQRPRIRMFSMQCVVLVVKLINFDEDSTKIVCVFLCKNVSNTFLKFLTFLDFLTLLDFLTHFWTSVFGLF